MHPLISPVDHESRYHHANNNDDDDESSNNPQEFTALLPRTTLRRRSTLTPIFVTIMLCMLVFGITIGTYLLIEQDKQWPVNIPFEMISRKEWSAKPPKWPEKNLTFKPATYIVLSHTGTSNCAKLDTCIKTLRKFQELSQNSTHNMTDVPFNFLISSDGETYEGRGWNIQGELDATLDERAIYVAVIGNYTVIDPSLNQLKEIRAFIDESIRRRKLSSSYSLMGRKFAGNPKRLFLVLSTWKHWNPKLGSQ